MGDREENLGDREEKGISQPYNVRAIRWSYTEVSIDGKQKQNNKAKHLMSRFAQAHQTPSSGIASIEGLSSLRRHGERSPCQALCWLFCQSFGQRKVQLHNVECKSLCSGGCFKMALFNGLLRASHAAESKNASRPLQPQHQIRLNSILCPLADRQQSRVLLRLGRFVVRGIKLSVDYAKVSH